ncbi:MAG: aldehyde dehydrogenase [Akkermansiaceae bacterium]|nr:aldehyde dehydrogenase [Akkermansiaceae bacterium]
MIKDLVRSQRAYYNTGETRSLKFRRSALARLRGALRAWEPRIKEALYLDLGKSGVESYMCELGMCLASLSEASSHLKRWMKPRRVSTPLSQFPGSSRVIPEPYGVVLIISPWNYPLLLSLDPLISAIAAGNCCILKPSRQTPHVAGVMAEMLSLIFPREYVAVVQGGGDFSDELLEQEFDYIFFTGSPRVGRKVMAAAAKHLTPVTLELGGKSPCIVDETTPLALAARRIAFGKVTNAGQTCVAPDYLLIHHGVQEEFVAEFTRAVHEMLGEQPLQNPDYVHIINASHFERLCGLMQDVRVCSGGGADPDTLLIEPTLLGDVKPESACMQEEIFGPLLPMITYEELSEVERFINARPKPLACYIFTSRSKTRERLLRSISSGGVCVNDTVVHLAVPSLPFGGVGESGMGAYHGRHGFNTFSHDKGVLCRGTWPDLPFRYMPWTRFKERLLRFFLR